MSRGFGVASKQRQARKYAELVGIGVPPFEAFLTVIPRYRKSPRETAWAEHGKFKADPVVIVTVRSVLQDRRVLDIDSVAQHQIRTMDARNAAVAEKNWTAAAAYDRLIAGYYQMVSDRLSIADERGPTAEKLLDQLVKAGADREQLRRVMGLVDEPSRSATDVVVPLRSRNSDGK